MTLKYQGKRILIKSYSQEDETLDVVSYDGKGKRIDDSVMTVQELRESSENQASEVQIALDSLDASNRDNYRISRMDSRNFVLEQRAYRLNGVNWDILSYHGRFVEAANKLINLFFDMDIPDTDINSLMDKHRYLRG